MTETRYMLECGKTTCRYTMYGVKLSNALKTFMEYSEYPIFICPKCLNQMKIKVDMIR